MGVFKDDRIVARVLGGQTPPPKKNNATYFMAAACAVAMISASVWAVVSHRNAAPAQASSAAGEPNETGTKNDATQAMFQPAVAKPSAGLGDASSTKKRLPPVIEEVTVSAVELNPKFAVRLVETPAEPAGRKATDASANITVSNDAGENYELARKLEEASKGNLAQLERARGFYQRALDSGKLPTALENQCLTRLNELTARLILDPKAVCTEPHAEFHKVEAGEVAEKIAKKYKVTVGELKRLNHLNDKLVVRQGQTLKVLTGETVLKVDKERLTGTLYIDGVFIRRYPVGIGPGNATPKGTYTVENKVANPDWYYEGKKVPFGDPKNILGTRWMGMANTAGANNASLGVHGTAYPESVPGRESKGCVRMHNEDVEELYDFMQQGGKVVIE